MIIKPGSPDENDEELEFIAYAIEEEESMTSSAYPNYKNSILSLDRIRDITEDLSFICAEEEEKVKKPLTPQPFRFDDDFLIYTSIPEALKEILSFLKEIDENLYTIALNIYLGQSSDTINIYSIQDDYYKKQIESGKLNKESLNTGGEGVKNAFVVLDAELNNTTYQKIKKIIGSGKCTFNEKKNIMHETAHFFDKSASKKAITLEDLRDPNYEPLPQLTSFFLTETTAIFFETIFAQHLAKKDPSLQPLADEIIEKRIGLNILAVEKTLAMTSMVSAKREFGFIPDGFLDYFADENKVQDLRDEIVFSPFLYHPRRYALAQLFVPTMLKIYNTDKEAGKGRIKKYLECCRNDDIMGALKSFDLDITDEKNYEYLLKNYRDYVAKYYYKNKPEPDMDR